MSMHLAGPQFLDISQYSEQQRRGSNTLLRASLSQNNVLIVLNAESDRGSHSEQRLTPTGATGVPYVYIYSLCQRLGISL